jgi:hypothetical protein
MLAKSFYSLAVTRYSRSAVANRFVVGICNPSGGVFGRSFPFIGTVFHALGSVGSWEPEAYTDMLNIQLTRSEQCPASHRFQPKRKSDNEHLKLARDTMT